MFFSFCAWAQTTDSLSDAEIQGRQLAQQLCEGWPESATNTGVLQIHNAQGKHFQIPVKCEVVVTATNWRSIYESTDAAGNSATLEVIHAPGAPNRYYVTETKASGPSDAKPGAVRGDELFAPFAGSDFWIADLGLEFFHWPAQKILKKELKRSRGCTVLESTNPMPSPGGYSRVVSWIDEETLGIVQADAYDAGGKLLKEFLPKDFKKVKGQWQVGSMRIDNVLTGSRTQLEFHLGGE
ncbi:MAG: outer membrane lipoprotein-sorting protein [Verrucomicrobiota bacterium]|jgi:hypothetical protein